MCKFGRDSKGSSRPMELTFKLMAIFCGWVAAIKLASEFHISLGHTVPIRIHQVDTIVPMLRRKFESQKRWVF